jgi:hypothetical protein
MFPVLDLGFARVERHDDGIDKNSRLYCGMSFNWPMAQGMRLRL